MTKILSKLPDGDSNGLPVIARALVETPHESHVIIAVIKTKTFTTDVDTNERVANARIERVEVVLPADLPAAEQLLRRSVERRHGGVTLSIEMEDEISGLLAAVARDWPGIDLSTGEVPMGGEEDSDG